MTTEQDRALSMAIQVVNDFFMDTSHLLQTARDILLQNHGYVVTRDARVVWAVSTAVSKPGEWFPGYLGLYAKKNDREEYVGLSIPLMKVYEGRGQRASFKIFGAKTGDLFVDKDNYWWCTHAALHPDRTVVDESPDGVSTVALPEGWAKPGHTIRVVSKAVWDIADTRSLEEFIDRIVELPT